MSEAVPEPIFPEEDPYPSYRAPVAIDTQFKERVAIDDYVRAAIVATGTILSDKTRRNAG
jgi:hypothetical protein